ncbi:ATP-dependent DNA ligase [Yonghaparkia sp. Root332]|uniref:DUF7882 family protein n=1 Tax=unclassified Microcella TaxID=2630066 RepID=UPI000A5D0641
MGQLIYASTFEARFDDRVLAHLQIVIVAKLRRQESFAFSWSKPREEGSGRASLWLHPAIPLVFTFHGGRAPTISRAWIEALMSSANSSAGLRIVPEPSGVVPPVTRVHSSLLIAPDDRLIADSGDGAIADSAITDSAITDGGRS